MTRTFSMIAVLVALALCARGSFGTPASAQSTSGSWSHFPAQVPVFKSVIRPPIKADGSSVVNAGSIIPVKFKLLTGPGVFLFDSVWSNNLVGEGVFDDDFATLRFTPASELHFDDITDLRANYAFDMGNCQGGSLRWSVTFDINNDNHTIPDPDSGDPDPRLNDKSIFIYYGDYPNFTDCTSEPNNQSGVNMIGLEDLRYDTSQLAPGTFYNTYANAVTLADSLTIYNVTLVLDSGWMQEVVDDVLVYKDQSVILTSARVNDNIFTPIAGEAAATCNLPEAGITVVEAVNGPIEDPLNAQFKFNDTFFRNTGQCTYTYNLDTNSLFGPGNYSVYVVINSIAVQVPGNFTLQ